MIKFGMLLLATAATAPALADQPLQFERNGIAYTATISDHDGARHIVGREVRSGRAFDLIVRDGRVTGTYDGDQVSYAAPAPARLALADVGR